MNTVFFRKLEIGRGKPKVAVPIAAETKEDILTQAKGLFGLPFDLVEWRVDHYQYGLEIAPVLETLEELRTVLGEIPLLVTFRTKREGGMKEISPEEYAALNLSVARSGNADGVDVEIQMGEETVNQIVTGAHGAGVCVVGSSHEFGYTPSREEMITRLCKAQDMGCDIAKLAVMPQSKRDVQELLSVTEEVACKYARQPIVTVSMGKLGSISRLCGEMIGSSITFGAAGQTSAPGQIPLEELHEALEIVHRAVERKKQEGLK